MSPTFHRTASQSINQGNQTLIRHLVETPEGEEQESAGIGDGGVVRNVP
jgi:hypothetical protein